MSAEAAAPRRSLFLPAALGALLLALAAGLRLMGLEWGLPTQQHFFSYHPDEIFLLLPSSEYFARGDWNPHFFNYGTLYIYLVGLPALWLGYALPMNLHALYLLGRAITAALGIASVPLLYFAVRREGRRLAAVGALLLALLPLHAISSHYATVDVPAAFWLVLAFLFALRGVSRWMGLAAGLSVGLAAATKYNAGLFLLPVIVAPLLLPPRQWRVSWLGTVLAGTALGFLLGCPYFWTPDFARGFLFELQHAREGGTLAFEGMGSGWGYHLLHGLPVALGFPLLLAVVVGVYATLRVPSRAARLSLLWVVFYLLVIGFGKERFIRYLVLLAPFLAVLAAHGLVWLWRAPRLRLVRGLTAAIGLAVVALTLLYTWGQVRLLTGDDPRTELWQRLGPTVLTLHRGWTIGLAEPPWFYSPPVNPYNAGAFSRQGFEELNRRAGGVVVITGWDERALRRAPPNYFALSDLESRDLLRLKDPAATRFMATLGQTYKYQAVFARPLPPGAWLAPGRAWAPPDWLYSSPIITLYHNDDTSFRDDF